MQTNQQWALGAISAADFLLEEENALDDRMLAARELTEEVAGDSYFADLRPTISAVASAQAPLEAPQHHFEAVDDTQQDSFHAQQDSAVIHVVAHGEPTTCSVSPREQPDAGLNKSSAWDASQLHVPGGVESLASLAHAAAEAVPSGTLQCGDTPLVQGEDAHAAAAASHAASGHAPPSQADSVAENLTTHSGTAHEAAAGAKAQGHVPHVGSTHQLEHLEGHAQVTDRTDTQRDSRAVTSASDGGAAGSSAAAGSSGCAAPLAASGAGHELPGIPAAVNDSAATTADSAPHTATATGAPSTPSDAAPTAADGAAAAATAAEAAEPAATEAAAAAPAAPKAAVAVATAATPAAAAATVEPAATEAAAAAVAAAAAAGASGEGPDPGLELIVWPEEEVQWRQMGHLMQWARGTRSLNLNIPPNSKVARVADTLRLAYNFPHLSALLITPASATWRVSQDVLGVCAELLGLRDLVLQGGTLDTRGLNLHALRSLKGLTRLELHPLRQGALGDEELGDCGLRYLTTIRHLAFRGCLDSLTDEGLCEVAALSQLAHLDITPLGVQVTRSGLASLTDSLSQLTSLRVGLCQAGQADILHGTPDRVSRMELVASCGLHEGGHGTGSSTPGATATATAPPPSELPTLLSTCTLCLPHQLVSLRLATIRVEDAAFMVALGTLTRLTCLSVAAGPARPATPPALINLAYLSQLRQLRELEFAVVGQRLALPLTVKLMSCLALSWPQLTSLSLSAMVPIPGSSPTSSPVPKQASGRTGLPNQATTRGKSAAGGLNGQRAPVGRGWACQLGDALGLLDAFSCLKKLALFAPLLEDGDGDVGGEEEEWGEDGSSSEEEEEGEEGEGVWVSGQGAGSAGGRPGNMGAVSYSSAASGPAASATAGGGGAARAPLPHPLARQTGGSAGGAGTAAGAGVDPGPGRRGSAGGSSGGGRQHSTRLVPVYLHRLPAGLEELVLERARVRLPPPPPPHSRNSTQGGTAAPGSTLAAPADAPSNVGAATAAGGAACDTGLGAREVAGPAQDPAAASSSQEGVPGTSSFQSTGAGAQVARRVSASGATLLQDEDDRAVAGADARAALWGRKDSSRSTAGQGRLDGARGAGCAGGGGGGGGVRGPVLPGLRALELSSCWVRDTTLTSLFNTASQLTRLELNEVRGVSGSSIAALTALTGLRHLEVMDSAVDGHSTHVTAARNRSSSAGGSAQGAMKGDGGAGSSGWWSWVWGGSNQGANPGSSDTVKGGRGSHDGRGGGAYSGSGGGASTGRTRPRQVLSNAALAHVAGCSALRHLQWAVGDPRFSDTAGAHPRLAARVLHALRDTLQTAYVLTSRGAPALAPYGGSGVLVPGDAWVRVGPDGEEDVRREFVEEWERDIDAALSGAAPTGAAALAPGTGVAGQRATGSRGRVPNQDTVPDQDTGALLHVALARAAGPLCLLEHAAPIADYDVWSNETFYEHVVR